jgi:predicted acetyltransferase
MSSSSFEITRVGPESEPILLNLLEYYLHDMAEWFQFDIGDDGRYGYDMSRHWEKDDAVYLARVDGKPAAFAFLSTAGKWLEDAHIDVEEFFVVRRFRRTGIGKRFISTLWDQQTGIWLIRVLEANAPAVPFWRNSVSSYTGDDYREDQRMVDGQNWSFFSFDNTSTGTHDDP